MEIKDYDNPTMIGKFAAMLKQKMSLMRIASLPRGFDDTHRPEFNTMAQTHYITELCDEYLDKLPGRIEEFITELERYFGEFQGNWKYYAASHRLDMIEEYGADESDYNEDGEIKKTDLTDDELKPYTIIHELGIDGWRDIIKDTEEQDFYWFLSGVQVDAQMDMSTMIRQLNGGKRIPSYRINDDGEFVENTVEDEDLMRASRMADADSINPVVYTVLYVMRDIYRRLEGVMESPFEDHRELLNTILEDCYRLRDFHLEDLSCVEKMRKEQEQKAKENEH